MGLWCLYVYWSLVMVTELQIGGGLLGGMGVCSIPWLGPAWAHSTAKASPHWPLVQLVVEFLHQEVLASVSEDARGQLVVALVAVFSHPQDVFAQWVQQVRNWGLHGGCILCCWGQVGASLPVILLLPPLHGGGSVEEPLYKERPPPIMPQCQTPSYALMQLV